MVEHPLQISPVQSGNGSVAGEHAAVIDQLAADSDWPVALVEEMYLHEVSELRRHATIENYVGVLATRRVRETLRHLPRGKR